MGLIFAGDEHNRHGDEALKGIENVKVVEDVLIFDNDFDAHVERVRQVFLRCNEAGITLCEVFEDAGSHQAVFRCRISKVSSTDVHPNVRVHLTRMLQLFFFKDKSDHYHKFCERDRLQNWTIVSSIRVSWY